MLAPALAERLTLLLNHVLASEAVATERRQDLADELADVLYYTLLMAHDAGIDLEAALQAKLKRNAEKYPVDKAKGSSKKYTEL